MTTPVKHSESAGLLFLMLFLALTLTFIIGSHIDAKKAKACEAKGGLYRSFSATGGFDKDHPARYIPDGCLTKDLLWMRP
jgi:hypothetical protein